MRKYIILLTALFTLGCQQGAMAQKSTDQIKEQKLLAREAKHLAKEGWKPIPGFKSVKEQLGETVSYSKDNDSTYILGASNAEAEDLITAYQKAYYIALVDITRNKPIQLENINATTKTTSVPPPSDAKGSEFKSKELISISGAVLHNLEVQDDTEKESWESKYLFEIEESTESHIDGRLSSTSKIENKILSEDVKTCYGIYRVQKDGKIEVRLMLAAPKK